MLLNINGNPVTPEQVIWAMEEMPDRIAKLEAENEKLYEENERLQYENDELREGKR